MLSKLAIWYLRKRKKSVMIGYTIEDAKIQANNFDSNIYNNHFKDCDYFTADGNTFEIPNGKFHVNVRGWK
jgi:hypothetical protein